MFQLTEIAVRDRHAALLREAEAERLAALVRTTQRATATDRRTRRGPTIAILSRLFGAADRSRHAARP
jgi:hypothetical protein